MQCQISDYRRSLDIRTRNYPPLSFDDFIVQMGNGKVKSVLVAGGVFGVNMTCCCQVKGIIIK